MDESVTVICGEDDECQDDSRNQYVALIVPFEAQPAIERFDLVITLGLSAAAIGATMLLVARRRPE